MWRRGVDFDIAVAAKGAWPHSSEMVVAMHRPAAATHSTGMDPLRSTGTERKSNGEEKIFMPLVCGPVGLVARVVDPAAREIEFILVPFGVATIFAAGVG